MELEKIRKVQKEIAVLQSISGHLMWDRDVYMPMRSENIRMNQEQVLAKLIHQKYRDLEFQDALQNVDRSKLNDIEKRELFLIERESALRTSLPEKFLESFIEVQSKTYAVFKEAKERSDFSIVEQNFSRLVDMYLETPSFFRNNSILKEGYSRLSDYDILIDANYDPGITNEFVSKIFSSLKNELVELRKEIPNSDQLEFKPQWNDQKLMKLSREICQKIGFDFSRGRLDLTSVHPFCGGSLGDTRITTKVEIDSPVDGLLSTLHEVGHGIYQQNLPENFMFSPLGSAASAAVHESQSRFIENQICRSKHFICFLAKISGENEGVLRKMLLGKKKTYIRVDADEIDYNLHIILRWEIEQQLVSGKIKAHQIPEMWNDLYHTYFGETVPNDSMGCLQDIHWYSIGFGYFPSYTLGNVVASQLFDRFKKENMDWGERIESGELEFINRWMKERVHQYGSLRDTLGTIDHALGGQKVDANLLLGYLRERYLNPQSAN